MELDDSINITYGILDQIVKAQDDEDAPVRPIIPCLDNISKKTENDIADIEKPHSFEKKDLQVT